MDKTQLLEKTTTVLMGAHEFQELAQRSVDLVVKTMGPTKVRAAAVFRVSHQAQTLYAYAYAAKQRALIERLLPSKFTEIHLPLSAVSNLTIKTVATGDRQQGSALNEFARPVFSESLSRKIQKLLGVKSIITLPVRSRSGKVSGVLMLLLKTADLESADYELFETYANQLGLAFSNVFAFERLMGAYKKKVASEEADVDEEDIPSIKFTLRLAPRQYKKLDELTQQRKKTRAEVIRQIIDEAAS